MKAAVIDGNSCIKLKNLVNNLFLVKFQRAIWRSISFHNVSPHFEVLQSNTAAKTYW